MQHQAGVWLPSAEVRELAILSDRYDMTISLLMFDKPGIHHDDDPTTQLPSL